MTVSSRSQVYKTKKWIKFITDDLFTTKVTQTMLKIIIFLFIQLKNLRLGTTRAVINQNQREIGSFLTIPLSWTNNLEIFT